ncbi:response regulator [Sulfurimonas sp.]|uniref:response regulator transcription factor n=1 Tax=Sulfurimonas sp. TaxID=2022749 RepID=UPI0025DA5ABB|nr:response regulator [Sulfurimonas sp.]
MDKNEYNFLIVVEDEVISTQYLTRILVKLGYDNIYEATNLDEAMKVVQDNSINLVFMDININGTVDGIALAQILNEEQFLPIIFTTAFGDSNTISEATATNIFGFLIKPFNKNDVESALSVALKRIKERDKYILNSKLKSEQDSCIIDLGANQTFDMSKKTFLLNSEAISLTRKEIDLLYILCKNINTNTSYETIKRFVWKEEISTSTIRDTASRLRKKTPNLDIENIVGVGYILKKVQ